MSSSFKRFFSTYKFILKLAYQISPSHLFFITFLQSIWGLTNLPVLYINKLLIDLVISAVGRPDWQTVARTIVLVIILRSLIEYIRFAMNRFIYPMESSLSRLLNAKAEILMAQKLNSLDVSTVESPAFQDKFKKIGREYNQRLWGMVQPISQIPNSVFTIISAAIALFTFNPWIGLAIIIFELPDVWLSAKFSKLEYALGERQATTNRLWGWTNHYLTNPQSFYENKILGTVKILTQKMNELAQQIIGERVKLDIKRSKFRSLAEIPSNLLFILLNSYFFILALAGKITLGSAQMLYQACTTLGNGFGMLLSNVNTIYANYLFASDFSWLLDLKSSERVKGRTPRLPFKKGIEFRHVWFKYPNSKNWILENVDLSIEPRENIALVGENGAGKTTLIKLLVGFYTPQKGQILVNGVDVQKYNIHAYRKILSVLFQDFSDYAFSAQESIGYGDISRLKNKQAIEAAAKLTGVHRFIQSLSLKYRTPLSKSFEKGVEPSKGQWQRIALARTLFKNGEVVVLDEPTSNVDPKAEEEIFEKIIRLARNKIYYLFPIVSAPFAGRIKFCCSKEAKSQNRALTIS